MFAKGDTTALQTKGVSPHTGRADGADYKEKKGRTALWESLALDWKRPGETGLCSDEGGQGLPGSL